MQSKMGTVQTSFMFAAGFKQVLSPKMLYCLLLGKKTPHKMRANWQPGQADGLETNFINQSYPHDGQQE